MACRDIFKHFSLLPFFRRRLSWGEDVKIFCGQGRTFQNILEGDFLCDYIVEGRVPRGATMVGAEQENFETMKSLDRWKWHFQSLVWPSAGCRAQKES
jgi:hypothetical protein